MKTRSFFVLFFVLFSHLLYARAGRAPSQTNLNFPLAGKAAEDGSVTYEVEGEYTLPQ